MTSAELLERLVGGRGLDGLDGVSYREQGRVLQNKAARADRRPRLAPESLHGQR